MASASPPCAGGRGHLRQRGGRGGSAMNESNIQRVAVVGTGVIGACLATFFLARGLDVTATDPAPGAEAALRDTIRAQWPAMERLGVAPGASPDRLRFAASPEAAVAQAQFVQENGPERVELKQDLFRRLDAAAPEQTILATSSSTITVSEFQDACARHPERVVLGHPFNPPHLIPLVEVAGGRATSADAVERALGFYRAIGKHPIHLRKEVRGHVANRLQAALVHKWVSAAGCDGYRGSPAAESSHAVQAQRTALSQNPEGEVQSF